MGSKMGHLFPHYSDVATSRNVRGKHCRSDRIEDEVNHQDYLHGAVSEDIRKEEVRGHGMSFWSTILLTIFGCSEAVSRCADDPPVRTKLKNGHSETLANPKSRRKFNSGLHQVSASASCKNLLKEPLVCKDEKQKADYGSPNGNQKDDALEHDSNMEDQGEKDKNVPSKLPSLSETSSLLSEALQECILPALPVLARGRQWTMVYSTRKHGISLLTLYRRSSLLPGPFLLVTGDTRGAILGAFLSELKPTPKKKYQGTSDTFVFTDVSGKPELYRATGVNRYFVLCTNEALAIGGGGHFALHLDNDLLTGSTGSCATFGNVTLAHSEEFIVKDVELWGFIHSSKYAPQKVCFEEPKEAPGISSW